MTAERQDEMPVGRQSLVSIDTHEVGAPNALTTMQALSAGALRIGLRIGFAAALLTLVSLVLQGSDPVSMVVAVLLLLIWLAAALRPENARVLLSRPAVLIAAVAVPASAASIGGALASPFVAQSFCVIGLAALIASPGMLGACVGTATVVYALACCAHPGKVGGVLRGYELTIAMNNIFDFFAIGALLFALAVAFRRVVIDAPYTLGAIRIGALAPTPLLGRAVRSAGAALPRVLGRADPGALNELLSPSERRVVNFLADGLTPKQIAHRLGRSLATIRSQLASAKRKTGARTLEQLVAIVAAAQRTRE